MIYIKHKITISAVVLATFIALSFGAIGTSAHFYAGDSEMTKTLASKLGVSEEKVKDAFTSMRADREAKMKADLEARLSQAVKDGKITEAQKSAILTKFGQEKTKIDPAAFKNMTPAQRKAEMEKRKTDLEAWAKENNLDLTKLNDLLGHGNKVKHFMKPM